MRIVLVQARSSAMPGSEETIDFAPRITEFWEEHGINYRGETGLYSSVDVHVPWKECPQEVREAPPPWYKGD